MTQSRYEQLMADETECLTAEELAEDWHFCLEMDGLLMGPETYLADKRCFCGVTYPRSSDDGNQEAAL